MGFKDVTITHISLLTGLKSSEVKLLMVIPIRCLLARLHLSKAWHLLLRLFLWWQCQTWRPYLCLSAITAKPEQSLWPHHRAGSTSLECCVHWHLCRFCKAQQLIVRKVNTSTCFYILVSLLQGEASLWVRHKPQQYWPCIQSIHWKGSFVSKW